MWIKLKRIKEKYVSLYQFIEVEKEIYLNTEKIKYLEENGEDRTKIYFDEGQIVVKGDLEEVKTYVQKGI